MSRPEFAEQPDAARVLQLDDDVEALRTGRSLDADRTLLALQSLRDDVDARVALLVGAGALEADRGTEADWPLPPPVSATVATEAGRQGSAGRRRLRLAVAPVAAALVIGSTGVAAALSSSPDATFYPLHQFVFGSQPGDRAPGQTPSPRRPSPASHTTPAPPRQSGPSAVPVPAQGLLPPLPAGPATGTGERPGSEAFDDVAPGAAGGTGSEGGGSFESDREVPPATTSVPGGPSTDREEAPPQASAAPAETGRSQAPWDGESEIRDGSVSQPSPRPTGESQHRGED